MYRSKLTFSRGTKSSKRSIRTAIHALCVELKDIVNVKHIFIYYMPNDVRFKLSLSPPVQTKLRHTEARRIDSLLKAFPLTAGRA